MKKLLCVVTASIIFANNTAFALEIIDTPTLPGTGGLTPVTKRLCVDPAMSLPAGCSTLTYHESSCYSDSLGNCGQMGTMHTQNGVVTFGGGCTVEVASTLNCYVTCSCLIDDYEYYCEKNYWGTPTNGSSGCTACPGGGLTESVAAESITECYLPANTNYEDSTGTYIFTDDCFYSNN